MRSSIGLGRKRAQRRREELAAIKLQQRFRGRITFLKNQPRIEKAKAAGRQKVLEKHSAILVQKRVRSIVYATAGPNTRTTQLFVNYKNNARLDAMGFAPFGNIVKGMDIAEAIYNPTPGNSGGIDQDKYTDQGNSWIKRVYPRVNFIVNASIRT